MVVTLYGHVAGLANFGAEEEPLEEGTLKLTGKTVGSGLFKPGLPLHLFSELSVCPGDEEWMHRTH
jgi:hypothetical protein